MKSSLTRALLPVCFVSLFGFLACAAPPVGDTIGSNEANSTKKTTPKKDTKTKTTPSGDDDEDEDDTPTTTGSKKRIPTPKTGESDFEDEFPSGPTGPGGQGDQCFDSCLTSSQAQQIDQQLMQCGEQQCGQSQDESCFMQCEQQICTGSKQTICQQMFRCFEGCEGGGQQQGGFPDEGGF